MTVAVCIILYTVLDQKQSKHRGGKGKCFSHHSDNSSPVCENEVASLPGPYEETRGTPSGRPRLGEISQSVSQI